MKFRVHKVLRSGLEKKLPQLNERGQLWDEIFRAMMANPALVETLQSFKVPSPANLSDLRSLLSQNQHAINVEGELFTLQQDFITRFTFHHIENDRVIVQLSLSPLGAAAQALPGTMNLTLKAPVRIQQDLASAQNLNAGFLAKDAETISRGQTTEFTTKF
jgi:hypothetical protein